MYPYASVYHHHHLWYLRVYSSNPQNVTATYRKCCRRCWGWRRRSHRREDGFLPRRDRSRQGALAAGSSGVRWDPGWGSASGTAAGWGCTCRRRGCCTACWDSTGRARPPMCSTGAAAETWDTCVENVSFTDCIYLLVSLSTFVRVHLVSLVLGVVDFLACLGISDVMFVVGPSL